MERTAQMTPQEAVQAIRDVREYRQGLTARAVGLVWVLAGLGVALLASLDLFIPASQLAGHFGGHSLYDLFRIWPAMLLMGVAALAAVLVGTYMVWQTHATVAEEGQRRGKDWAAALGLAVGFMAAAVAILFVVETLWSDATGDSLTGGNHAGFSAPIWAAFVALTLAFRLRQRVPKAPGLWAAGALFLGQILLGSVTQGFYAQQVAQGAGYVVFLDLATFTVTGLVYFHRG